MVCGCRSYEIGCDSLRECKTFKNLSPPLTRKIIIVASKLILKSVKDVAKETMLEAQKVRMTMDVYDDVCWN